LGLVDESGFTALLRYGDGTIIGHLSIDVHRALGTDETHPKATLWTC
jgi:hypothetical protein